MNTVLSLGTSIALLKGMNATQTKGNTMKKEITKEAAIAVAKEENMDVIEMLSMMQTACAQIGDDETIAKIGAVKLLIMGY